MKTTEIVDRGSVDLALLGKFDHWPAVVCFHKIVMVIFVLLTDLHCVKIDA